jgi:hypothetical protein
MMVVAEDRVLGEDSEVGSADRHVSVACGMEGLDNR